MFFVVLNFVFYCVVGKFIGKLVNCKVEILSDVKYLWFERMFIKKVLVFLWVLGV